jgi:hypothetical protein
MMNIESYTSSITLKKSVTGAALLPRDPSTVPKVRQKKMIPRVLVPDLNNHSITDAILYRFIFIISLNFN